MITLSTRQARILIGLSFIFSWLTFIRVPRVSGTPFARGLSSLIDLSMFTQFSVFLLCSLLLIISTIFFILEKKEIVAAIILIGLLALYTNISYSQWEGDNGSNRAPILSGAGIFAYITALYWNQRKNISLTKARTQGIHSACGIAGAGYSLAALNKLEASGWEWLNATTLSTHITIHAYNGVDWIRPFRLWIAEQRWLCLFFSVGTIVLEGSGFLLLYPTIRTYIAIGIAILHLSIALFTGLHHYDWMFAVLGFALYPTGKAK